MGSALPPELDDRFDAILFDWDGTAVASRSEDATGLRTRIEGLCATATQIAIVTGTTLAHVDDQLRARPEGPGELLIATNRGSELFRVSANGPQCLQRRTATAAEEAALDAAAEATRIALVAAGLPHTTVVSRMNRRKIDLYPAWVDPPKSEIDALLRTVEERLSRTDLGSLAAAVRLAEAAAADAGLVSARVTSDAKHIEIGLTDKRDAVAGIRNFWWARGVGSGLVAVFGDEFGSLGSVPGSDAHLLGIGPQAVAASVGIEPEGLPVGVLPLPGGPAAFAAALDDQLDRRAHGALPRIDRDPQWTISLPAPTIDAVRANEARAVLSDGVIGVRAAAMHGARSEIPMTLLANAYVGTEATTTLLPAPDLAPERSDPHQRSEMLLDLRTGVCAEVHRDGTVLGIRFLDPDVPAVLTIRDRNGVAALEPPLRAPADAAIDQVASGDGALVVSAASTSTAAALMDEAHLGGTRDRHVAFAADATTARAQLTRSRARSFDARLANRRRSMAARWNAADIACTGDPDLERALRYSLFHLMQCAPDSGEAFVGARGLSGPAYRGHIFWDADVFVLPFLAATHPCAARAMLEYRLRRITAANAIARASGYRGARFPWESAGTGADVTPTFARSRSGAVIPIRTGTLELHHIAGIAWATREYLLWADDRAFAASGATELFTETARFWASRIRIDAQERGHIYGVIGPDEYHEPVDDNAYTNVMAAQNLRWAADHADNYADGTVSSEERDRWRSLADAMSDGYDADRGLYEEFAGFFDLEPLVIAEVAPRRPIAADLFLGADRVHQAQVIKQADVLMLHHLVPESVVANSLEANLRFYEPRTAHGSSLSPGIHAALLARAGRPDEAIDLLRVAAHIDLDDITDTTAQGLHLATMGSVWQAWVFGLLGCRARADHLTIDPAVPKALGRIGATVQYRGGNVEVSADTTRCTVTTVAAMTLRVGASSVFHPGGVASWRRTNDSWEREQ